MARTARKTALELVARYYDAFNRGDVAGMLDCLADDVVHDVNQGPRRTGKAAFAAFLAHMNRCYLERLEDVVLMAADDGTRAAAEFVVEGFYQASDEGLPDATGQSYRLPAGAFLAIADGRIARVTTCYNLQDWIRQVAA
jgi:steroid delta-isomerase-like uncharacterized protein